MITIYLKSVCIYLPIIAKCKVELTMIFLETKTDKDICKCKFRTNLV